MLPPDQLKGYADIAVTLLGGGGLGAIVLAIIGMKKAATEAPPPPTAPAVPPSSMSHLAGMMVGEHFGMQLLEKLQHLGDGVHNLVRAHEAETRAIREAADERRGDVRRLSEAMDGVADRLKERRQS